MQLQVMANAEERTSVAIVLAVATFVAGGALAFLFFAMPVRVKLAELQGEAEQLRADNALVRVVKAKQAMTQWSIIRDPNQTFEVVLAPRKQVLVEPILLDSDEKLAELKGRRLRRAIDRGETLTEQHLLGKESLAFSLTLNGLEKGPRAMAVTVRSDLIGPGKRVNVIHKVDGASNVILTDILVLAVDSFEKGDDPKSSVLTLRLEKTDDVLTLAKARDTGTLSVVLSTKD